MIQLSQAAAGDDLAAAAEAAGLGCVTHSVFGVSGELAALEARLKAAPEGRARLAAAGHETAADLLLARAFARNPRGVVLASMAAKRSLAANLAAAARPFEAQAAALCAEIGA